MAASEETSEETPEEIPLLPAAAQEVTTAQPATTLFVTGVTASVLCTAGLVVSNKELLRHAVMRQVGPSLLLLLHKVVAWILFRAMYCCKPLPVTSFTWLARIGVVLLSNNAVIFSMLTLQEASVAFQQLTRLMALPLSAAVDLVFYGKARGKLESFSLLLLSYGVFMSQSGEATSTRLAWIYTSVCILCSLGCTALCRHVQVTTGMTVIDFLALILPLEVAFAAVQLLLMWVCNQTRSADSPGSVHVLGGESTATASYADPLLLVCLVINCSLACIVSALSTWTQGKCSNMLSAVLGQAKAIVSVAVGAAVFHAHVAGRGLVGMAIVVILSFQLALGDRQPSSEGASNRSSQPRWTTIAFFVVVSAAVAGDLVRHQM